MSSSRRANQTLKRQLVVRITLIVTVVCILLSACSALLVSRILTTKLDQQLLYAFNATENRPQGPDAQNRFDPTDGGGLRLGGLPVGSISLAISSSGVVRSSIIWEYGSTIPDAGQLEVLLDLPRDGIVRSVRIEGLGRYQAVAVTSTGSTGTTTMAVAAPTAANDAIVASMLWIELGLIILAAAAAAGISTVVVKNSLRPLTRLADTATQVAALPLESGEVAIDVRVPRSQAAEQSEVGRVSAAFNSMLDNVETSLQARQASETKVRQFVADASHELRNPLASIRGYAELTRRGREELPADTVFALGRIESESQRMSRLVEQMLLLARLDNDPAAARDQVDLSEVTLNAVSDARAAGPDHHWRVQVPDEPVMISGDAGQVQQVMVNLLGNARKHTPAGTTVTTSVSADDGWARIEVADNGPGIPPALTGQIFERFTKADAARAHDAEGSTGLGLAIVAAVATAHGGRVEVESRPATETEPGYSRFIVRLPLTTTAEPSDSQPTA